MSALCWNDERGARIEVFASVSDAATRRFDDDELPAAFARPLRAALAELGFSPDGARSPRTGKVLTNRVGYGKRVATSMIAARDCSRTLTRLQTVVRSA